MQNADCTLQTREKMQTEGKMEAAINAQPLGEARKCVQHHAAHSANPAVVTLFAMSFELSQHKLNYTSTNYLR